MKTIGYKFGDIASFKYGKLPKKGEITDIGKYPIYTGYRFSGNYPSKNLEKGQLIIVARGVGGIGDVKLAERDCFLTNLSISVKVDSQIASPRYLYYYFKQNHLKYLDSGSAQSQITISDLERLEIQIPTLSDQGKIVNVLQSLDEKIKLNYQINKNLMELVNVIFEQKILKNPSITAWKQESLLDIADFQNGLPMQKFRPDENEEQPLKVIKIKELSNQRFSETSELCSATIDKKKIVDDGDLLFSWSGTLLVDFWTGGRGGLNQHLYKVTPKNYPIWLVYCWVKYHLREFQNIAKAKATTMGHIKRSDLENAAVYLPPTEELESLDKLLSPILRNLIVNRIASRTLSKIRDELLPKLLSSEIKIQ